MSERRLTDGRPINWTLGQLRAALLDVDPSFFDCEVVMRISVDDGDDAIGGLVDVTIDQGCSDEFALCLDGSDQAVSPPIALAAKGQK